MSDPKSPARPAGRTVVRKTKIKHWNAKRKQAFLARLAETANVSSSARAVGLSKTAAYDLKRRDPVFAEAWRDALEVGYCELEMKLLREAIRGTRRVETMEIGPDRQLKYVKTVESSSSPGALRLLMAHREEVMAHRQARAQQEPLPKSATDEAQAWVDEIEVRLRETEGEARGDSDNRKA